MNNYPMIRRTLYCITMLLVASAAYVVWILSQNWYPRVQRSLAHNAWEDNTIRMRLCLLLGASPNGTVAGTGPALTAAAAAGRLDSIRFLLAHGSNINIHDKWGLTPLMWASSKGRIDIVRFLLDAGADPNIVSHGYDPGATALGVARNQSDITSLLLSRGAIPLITE